MPHRRRLAQAHVRGQRDRPLLSKGLDLAHRTAVKADLCMRHRQGLAETHGKQDGTPTTLANRERRLSTAPHAAPPRLGLAQVHGHGLREDWDCLSRGTAMKGQAGTIARRAVYLQTTTLQVTLCSIARTTSRYSNKKWLAFRRTLCPRTISSSMSAYTFLVDQSNQCAQPPRSTLMPERTTTSSSTRGGQGRPSTPTCTAQARLGSSVRTPATRRPPPPPLEQEKRGPRNRRTEDFKWAAAIPRQRAARSLGWAQAHIHGSHDERRRAG
jgi:hypothetical protein